jgi:CdiI N-terminal domain
VFSIRIITPVVTDAEGRRQAGGVLAVGQARLPFFLDCSHWSASDYERQWKEGIHRIAEGARSSALLTAYRGNGDEPHTLWAMWRDHDHIYVQARTIRPLAFAAPFDPWDAYDFVPSRMPVGEYVPPATQWRVELESFFASAFGVRVPFHAR